jgi:hypothetical protein
VALGPSQSLKNGNADAADVPQMAAERKDICENPSNLRYLRAI